MIGVIFFLFMALVPFEDLKEGLGYLIVNAMKVHATCIDCAGRLLMTVIDILCQVHSDITCEMIIKLAVAWICIVISWLEFEYSHWFIGLL